MLPRVTSLLSVRLSLAFAALLGSVLYGRAAQAEEPLAPGFLCLGESESLMRGTSLDEQRRERDKRLADLAANQVAPALLPHTHCVVAELMRRVGDTRAAEHYEAAIALNPQEPAYELSTGSLWLGRHPGPVRRTLSYLSAQSGGENLLWRDLFWMLEATTDPERAAKRFDDEHYFEAEFGSSLAHTYQWLESLRALGSLAPSVTANSPFHAAFQRAGRTTHVAFAPSTSAVTFSDGASLRGSGLLSDLQ